MRSLLIATLLCLGGCATLGTGVSPEGRQCAFASPLKGNPTWVVKGDDSNRYAQVAAAIGTPFYAVEGGTVVETEVSDSLYMSGHVTIQVSDEVKWHYHFGKGLPLVHEKDRVEAGEQLGVIGESSGIRDPSLSVQRVRKDKGMLFYDDPMPYMQQAHACEAGLPIPRTVLIARTLAPLGTAPSATLGALAKKPPEVVKQVPLPTPKVDVPVPAPPPVKPSTPPPRVATPTVRPPTPIAPPRKPLPRRDFLKAIAELADRQPASK